MDRLLVWTTVLSALVFPAAFGAAGCDRGGLEPASESDGMDLELTARQTQVYGKQLKTLPDEGLKRQGGEPFSFDDLDGTPVLLSAVYTNCPKEKMCPLLTSKVGKTQQQLLEKSGIGPGDFRVVLFSFDPERDTPDALKTYAEERGVSADNADFVSGDPAAVSKVMEEIEIATKDEGDGTFTHNMRVYLTDADGRIYSGFRQAKWSPGDVAERFRPAINP